MNLPYLRAISIFYQYRGIGHSLVKSFGVCKSPRGNLKIREKECQGFIIPRRTASMSAIIDDDESIKTQLNFAGAVGNLRALSPHLLNVVSRIHRLATLLQRQLKLPVPAFWVICTTRCDWGLRFSSQWCLGRQPHSFFGVHASGTHKSSA